MVTCISKGTKPSVSSKLMKTKNKNVQCQLARQKLYHEEKSSPPKRNSTAHKRGKKLKYISIEDESTNIVGN